MTVTMAAEVLAWSQETEPDEPVSYRAVDDERAAWVAAWAYAAWLALTGLVLAAAITGALMLTHTDHPPASSEAADGGAAAMNTPVVSPALPTIPDEPDVAAKDGNPDKAFLSTLHTGTTGWNDPAATYIEWAHWVCQSVAFRGVDGTITELSKPGDNHPIAWTVASSRFYVATAMKAYCPGSAG